MWDCRQMDGNIRAFCLLLNIFSLTYMKPMSIGSEMKLTRMMEFISGGVTCLALSMAPITCCWCWNKRHNAVILNRCLDHYRRNQLEIMFAQMVHLSVFLPPVTGKAAPEHKCHSVSSRFQPAKKTENKTFGQISTRARLMKSLWKKHFLGDGDYLFVHFNVQPIGHLIVLQWTESEGDKS